jgi:hypothetical protein
MNISADTNTYTLADAPVTVRPIRHSDRVLEKNFIEKLSAEAKHFRFLGGISSLSESEIDLLCDVDYHDSMAFVATINNSGKEEEVGVARYSKDANSEKHEMAVCTADAFKNTGLDEIILNHLFEYAKKNAVNTLYSIEFYDNRRMRELADVFKMDRMMDPSDTHQVIYTLALSGTPSVSI